jgi:ATP-dependent DNA helicase RecG
VPFLTADEIYATSDAELFSIIKEDRRIERKPAGIHPQPLAQYFSMWANTPPDGGVIAVGVENDGRMSGIVSVATHINDLERAGDNCCPDARYETRRCTVVNAKGQPDQMLLIRVFYHETKVVRMTDGSSFDRRGGSKRTLTDEQIRELQIEKGELSWEREPSSLAYPDDFDRKSLSNFAQAIITLRKLEHVSSIRELLSHRRLGKLNGTQFSPNKACALLFALDPKIEVPGCFIRFLRFDGRNEELGERRNQLKDEWIEGNLPSQLDQAERIIAAQLREFSRLGKDGKFITTEEYPKAAWLEAVVNAVVHRSYHIGNVPIFVKMFDDRLEVESPGGFMPFVTPENIYERHDPRNPTIMESLFFLDRVKCANEGTKRMRQTMQDLDLPDPAFVQQREMNPKITVVLKNDVEHRKVWLDSDVSRLVGEAIFQVLSADEKLIVNYVSQPEHGRINVSDAVRVTRKAWGSCKKLLDGLVRRGLLRHVHGKERDPKSHYVWALPRPIGGDIRIKLGNVIVNSN